MNNLAYFQLELLTKLIDIEKFPFTKLIIENNITEADYKNLFEVLNQLDKEYHEQIEEGLLDYSSHLARFVGMLPEKLEPKETIYALKKEGYYPELLDEFIRIIHKNGL